MSGRIRPSARKKTLNNVMHSNLSITDKRCIEEVFEKFGQRVEVIRCADCICSEKTKYKSFIWCSQHLTTMRETDYCSHAERKEA